MPFTQRLCLALPVITIALTSCLSPLSGATDRVRPGQLPGEPALRGARAGADQQSGAAAAGPGTDARPHGAEPHALGGSIHPELQRTLGAIQGHLQHGDGIALSLKATESGYERLFPRRPVAKPVRRCQAARGQERWEEEYAGLKRAALLQGQIGDGIDVDSRLLGQAMDRSRVANGALEVAQAGNELTGLGVKQALALQSLLAAQHRAETLKSARDLASEEEARQRFKTFLGPRAGERAQR